MVGAHAEHRLHMRPLGKFVEPVAVREAQEGLEIGPDAALETAHRHIVADIEVVDRIDQHLGKDQQRRPVQVGDQEDQEILVAELGQHAAVTVGEERENFGVADHRKCIAGAHEAGIRPVARVGPETVVAEIRFSNSMTIGSLTGSVSSGCSMVASPMRIQSSRVQHRAAGRRPDKAITGMRWYSISR
jgi:3'-phosphoadenosine 5'-phosphosulfate (PAPS) 3'-phosphatase